MAARGAAAKPKPSQKALANAGPVRLRAAADDEPGIPDILKFTASSNGHVPEVRIPLFSVNDVVYTIPAEPNLTIGLEASHIMSDTSIPAGIAASRAYDYVLTTLLGVEGYAALRKAPGITKEGFAKVVAICAELTLGALEDPKDGSGGA